MTVVKRGSHSAAFTKGRMTLVFAIDWGLVGSVDSYLLPLHPSLLPTILCLALLPRSSCFNHRHWNVVCCHLYRIYNTINSICILPCLWTFPIEVLMVFACVCVSWLLFPHHCHRCYHCNVVQIRPMTSIFDLILTYCIGLLPHITST